ncbi:MAG: MazG nucleotide pyrophosphohydrolase domain-containing protein [Nanoarchaeota archaeon]
MTVSFDTFLKLIRKSVELDPWIKETGIEGYGDFMIEETNEVIEALKNNDVDNLKEELGDVLSLWAIVCMLAEEEKLFDTEEVIKKAIEKIRSRRPYVFEDREVSNEEAVKIWYAAKDKEKKLKAKKTV